MQSFLVDRLWHEWQVGRLVISLTYMKTNQSTYSQSFTLTMVVLPVIVAIIILLIGSNIARAFSLAGAFSIIRFRSAPGDPKDIAYVLFTMASGLACGVGAFGYAVLFTIILCVLMFVLSRFNFGGKKSQLKTLKVTIPENSLNIPFDIGNRCTEIMRNVGDKLFAVHFVLLS
ncbi:DUF4956 domain-containing protein [Acinetobacter sp. VT 511]|uniref:DUF4956 domain-containing protein n=1 Tax=Acinetobacter sp. VT 511 TaxID=1675902 RepID=UPI0034D1A218